MVKAALLLLIGLLFAGQAQAQTFGATRPAVGVFNVAWFGATGNGVTDDTAAIQAAENAAEANGGGTLQFPCGNYLTTTGPIVINAASGLQPGWLGNCQPLTYGESAYSGHPYSGATIVGGNNQTVAPVAVTVTSATPAVVTWTSHGFAQNRPVFFMAQAASVTATIAGNVMTVSAVGSGTLGIGDMLIGLGLPRNLYIGAEGSGAGNTGTYYLSQNVTIAAGETITAYGTGTTGMPTGMVSNNLYWVYAPTTSTFELCTTYTPPGSTCGALVNTTSAGTSVVGSTFGDDVFENAGQGNLTQQGALIDGMGFIGSQDTTTNTFTASSSSITWTGHGLTVNQPVYFSLGGGGVIPTGLTAFTGSVSTLYYVNSIIDANTYTVSALPGGTVITPTTAGTQPIYGNTTAGNGLRVLNVMGGNIIHSSFRDAYNGIYMDPGIGGSAEDDSDWTINGSYFRNNVMGVNFAGTVNTAAGDNIVEFSRLNLTKFNDIGVNIGFYQEQVRVVGNHCNGQGGGYYQVCVNNVGGSSNAIIGNAIENPTVLTISPSVTGTGTNNGWYRGFKIEGNSISGDTSGGAQITTTCTFTASSATLTACGTTTGVVPGMIAVASNTGCTIAVCVPQMAQGSGLGSFNQNQLSGGTYVVTVPSSSSVTLTNVATTSGTGVTVNFELPDFSWPSSLTTYLNPVVLGNNYSTFHGPTSLGNDGY
jgi:hypothetical protein